MTKRKVFYVDVGKMSSNEAEKSINKHRNDLGLEPIKYSNDYLIKFLIILAGITYTATKVLEIMMING